MRAKTKKDLILQLIIVAIILPLIFWWHPTGEYRFIFKWGAIILSSLLYFVLNRVWKWKEADEDEKPLWYEKKQRSLWEHHSSNEEKPMPNAEKAAIATVTKKEQDIEAERYRRDRRNNLWLIVAFAALALLMVTGIALVSTRSKSATCNQVYINTGSPKNDVLNDGTFVYTGEWKGQGVPQKCQLEFTIENGEVKNAIYTNINYNVQIPLLGHVEDKRLIFTDLSGGQNLMLDLSIPYESITYIEGYGMDYEHENQTSQLVLQRVIKD
ncbi:MAG: hypothetical protein K5778_02140 [Bacteroidaceae bacterium]|nr:hypothetical protein [Bacteroidaceae bacterium]